jgi:hypothetical protein
MELAGKTKLAAHDHLERFDFSLAEAYEITGQFVTGDTDKIAAPWSNIADAIKSTMATSVRLKDRLDMKIDGLPQAYSHHNDQAMSKDGLTELVNHHHNDQAISGDDIYRRQREKALGFRKATADWADCKKVIMCIWPGQTPRGPVDVSRTYFHTELSLVAHLRLAREPEGR